MVDINMRHSSRMNAIAVRLAAGTRRIGTAHPRSVILVNMQGFPSQLVMLRQAGNVNSTCTAVAVWTWKTAAAAGAILQFVADTTTRVEGVGDVCSLAVFDFDRHGNSKYGAPAHAPAKRLRSKQVRGLKVNQLINCTFY
jgi:hypothetical protein